MAEARGRANWAHTSTVLALLANVNRDPKKTRAFRPSDFNPFEARRARGGVPLTVQNMGILKQVFVPAQAGVDRKGRAT